MTGSSEGQEGATERVVEREVVDTFEPNNRIRAKAVELTAGSTERHYLDVFKRTTHEFGSIDGTGNVEREVEERIARIPSGRGYDVLLALAEAYDCEVVEA